MFKRKWEYLFGIFSRATTNVIDPVSPLKCKFLGAFGQNEKDRFIKACPDFAKRAKKLFAYYKTKKNFNM